MLQIILYFIHNVTKLHFDVHFIEIPLKVMPWRYPLFPSFQSVLLLFHTTQGWEKSLWAVVHSPVWRQPEFQSVSGPGPGRVQGKVVGLSLAFPKWNDDAAPFRANLRNHRGSITHLLNYWRGKFTPCESKVKTEQTLVLDGHHRTQFYSG